jgi:hypothetical protein
MLPLSAFEDIPESETERALYLQNMLIAVATGGSGNDAEYKALRHHFMEASDLKQYVPEILRTCRDRSAFWECIKGVGGYADRRSALREAFTPLLDHLENKHRAPLDLRTSDALSSFDTEGVHSVWEKALARRETDPEGAITSARTLLETVCKHILDGTDASAYDDSDDLPKLYAKAAKHLEIAPSQYSEDAFKRILGGATSVVEGLGSLRNRISDAHGRGKLAVRPAPRHASLAVYMAGTMATFLIETWQSRRRS